MTKTIKNKIILSAILFASVFSISGHAVERKYIPNTADAVLSFNLDNLSKKAEGDLQQILNSLFMQRFADGFLETRDDEAVAEAMTNRLVQLFDFSKDSKIISLNDYRRFALMIDILDITELDKLMIKIASQEDKLISFSSNANYRYLSLDENTLISWNNEIFTVSLRGLIFEDNDNIIDSPENIFNAAELENEYFTVLENETNDCYVWMDLSILSDSESSLFELFGNMSEDIKDIYKGGILTAKVNFNDGIADMIFDTYLPNNDYDILSTKKELPEKELLENLYKFVNGNKNYGFLSFRFNSSSTLVKSFISSFVNNEISSQLLELCDGDIFVSAWDTEEENTAILFSMSITDEEKVKNALKTLSDKQEGEIYIIDSDYYYINNSILYMVNEESVINSIAKGETPNSTLDEDKLKLANDNMLSLYFNFNTDLGLLFGLEKYIGEFDSLSLTSNILDNNHTQTIVKVDAKDKTKNILIIIKTLIENIK